MAGCGGGEAPDRDAAPADAAPGDAAIIDAALDDAALSDAEPSDAAITDGAVSDAPTDARSTDDAAPDAAVTTCHPVINEIKTRGATAQATDDEFIELYQPCATPFTFAPRSRLLMRTSGDPTSYVLRDLSGVTMAAGSYRLYVGTGYTGSASASDGTFGSSIGTVNWLFADSAIAIGAWDAAFTAFAPLDSVAWGIGDGTLGEGTPATLPPIAGKTLARTPNGRDSNDNLTDFGNNASPTPKSAN